MDDVDRFAEQHLALCLDHLVKAELAELSTPGALGDGDQRVVEVFVGQEEGVGVEGERDRRKVVAVEAALVVELNASGGSEARGLQDVVVGHH